MAKKQKKDERPKCHLEGKIINSLSFDMLPARWQQFDFVRFSQEKNLFDFQQTALKNVLKGLWLYYIDKEADKKQFYRHYTLTGLTEDFDYNLGKKQDGKTAKYLLEFDKDYPPADNKISFAHFINRMSFWMATGSGKTLVIVKLIELLGKLIKAGEILQNDILFLTHRQDLIEQFQRHIDEFNSFNFTCHINLKNLRDYESVKQDNALPFDKNEITVFYYRSDLISDEHKEKIVNFRNYDNFGRWFILLDEAHKGDREDSKRQIYYSILSRNGFLFNFSATFTDPRDFATCAFNYNLSKYVEDGYGKHIYVSQADLTAFRNETDFSPIEKQKIVLKSLLLLTYINKHLEKNRKIENSLYHRPLLLTLVNSVNKPDADLQLFFKEIEKIAKEEPRLLIQAKKETIESFRIHSRCEIGDNIDFSFNENAFNKISYKDILYHVFNTKKSGAIEISFRPSDKKQVAFKLVSSDRHFALIKTGEMPQWLKDELNRFNINQRFEDEGFFETLNQDDSDINILMGSRSFYEGWDSNRPNIVLFVNIGVGTDAKKFVLQATGRGVRIEPLKNKRRRLQNLFSAKQIDTQLFEKVKDFILPLETLFVFGTNAANLKEIIKTLQAEKQEEDLGNLFVINPEVGDHPLLIPVYKDAEKILAEQDVVQEFSVSLDDLKLTRNYFQYMGDKVSLVKYDCEVKVLKKTNETFKEEERYYNFNKPSLHDPQLTLGRIFSHLALRTKEFEKFKLLENEIVHFRRIRFFDGQNIDELKQKIEQIRQTPEKQKEMDDLFLTGNRAEYDCQKKLFDEGGSFEMHNQKIRIKYLANHYYLPVIVSEQEKVDYINHIVDVPSERKFIEDIESYLQKQNNTFKEFDWWFFSKLDQTLDEIFIPYYNQSKNEIDRYHPDFIFWMQKGNQYLILFVDPKGTSFADYQHKVDGYRKIFEGKEYSCDKKQISTKLLFYTDDISKVGAGYRKYWFDNFTDFISKI